MAATMAKAAMLNQKADLTSMVTAAAHGTKATPQSPFTKMAPPPYTMTAVC